MPRAEFHDGSAADRFAEEIDEHLKHRFGYKTRCAFWSDLNNTVMADRAKMDIYLRFPDRFNKRFESSETLVIARIGFAKQRVGHGTWLLELLARLAPKYGYKSIALESTSKKDGIQNFIRKFGFQPLPLGKENPRDWIIPVKDLEARLFPPGGGAASV